MTIQELQALGANTEEGLGRCLNNEDFYLRLVKMALEDDGYARLRAAIEAHDLDEGFERPHALKGMLGNVSLTNLVEPIIEMTEALRAREDRDYSELLNKMDTELEKLRAL